MKKIKIFAIAALMMGFVACQKEENNDKKDGGTPAPTKQEILASKTWTLTGMTISPAMSGVTDIYPMVDACAKDNTWKFSNDANRTLVIDEGAKMCNGSKQTTTTTWSLDASGDRLTIDKYEYNMTDLNSTGFKLLETMTENGKTYTITSIYSGK
jgi:hypothetical protein